MLFKFKSKAAADLVMLEADGRRVLKAMIGDDPVKGIVLSANLLQALTNLNEAVARDEALRALRAQKLAGHASAESELDPQEQEPDLPAIRLAQRALPMQHMLERCMAEEADLVWGV